MGLNSSLSLVKNYFGCQSKDGLAASLCMRFVNQHRPWTHFLTARPGSLRQLPPSLLGPVHCCLFMWQGKPVGSEVGGSQKGT